MVEHFDIECLNLHHVETSRPNDMAVRHYFRAKGEEFRGWRPTNIAVDDSHGIHWFTLFCIGKPEFIGFKINHNRRADPFERGDAYDRLVPNHQYRPHVPRYRPSPDWEKAGRKKRPQRPSKGRKRIGRSHRRF